MLPSKVLPSQEEALGLHQQLLAGVPVAPARFAEAYLLPLIAWLDQYFPNVADDLRADAAERAILSFIKNPDRYQPERLPLVNYLHMAASSDLRNLQERERKHQQGRISVSNDVELSEHDRNYLEDHSDPSAPLQEEEQRESDARSWAALEEACGTEERAVLTLMRQGEKKTSVFAEALGIGHLSQEEQQTEVWRIKDRLMKKLQRRSKAL